MACSPSCSARNLSNDNCVLTVDLTNPDIIDRDRIALRKSLLHVARTRLRRRAILCISGSSFATMARITCPWCCRCLLPPILSMSSRCAGWTRARRGTTASEIGQGHAALDYMGLDGVTRRIEVRFDPPPTVLTTSSASFRLHHRTAGQRDDLSDRMLRSVGRGEGALPPGDAARSSRNEAANAFRYQNSHFKPSLQRDAPARDRRPCHAAH